MPGLVKLLLGAVGWKPLAAIAGLVGLAQLGTLGALGWQTLQLSWAREKVAQQETMLATQRAAIEAHKVELATAERSIATCVGANQGQGQAIDRILDRHRDELRLLAEMRAREAAVAPEVKIVKERIHVEAKACAGAVHPAIRRATQWVRDKDGLDSGRAGKAGDAGGGKDQPGAARPAR